MEVHYRLFHSSQLIAAGMLAPPFTVGRQAECDQPAAVGVLELPAGSPQFAANASVQRKLVIAPLNQRGVPRLAVKIDVDSAGQLQVHNLHHDVELQLAGNRQLAPQQQVPQGQQTSIGFPGEYWLQLSLTAVEADAPTATSLGSQCIAASAQANLGPQPTERLVSIIHQQETANYQELAVRLVRLALEAFQQPPGSKQFFDAAGRAAIAMIDLDRVAVLRKAGGQWVCRALSIRPGLDPERAAQRHFSQTLLAQMERAGQTTCISPQSQAQDVGQSITECDRAVAAPIFDEHKQIVGALYGDRLLGESDNVDPIGDLEAALLEVIASGISSGLAIKQEQQLRSAMAQFFSPEVLEQLQHDPGLLEGRVAQVSVLFCDIRGFSTVTERIGPTQAVAWINDVLTVLSQCVLQHDGVLVDYIGDELMAMWGAPGSQPDHAQRACLAALDMLEQLQPLRLQWQAIVPQCFELGIGINSGPASVGNTGSKQKFKYGPFGNTVNVASRVQGMSKQFGIPGLVTGQTVQLLSAADAFLLRRLATVRAVGIAQPLDLYELLPAHGHRPSHALLCQRYEQALQAFESGDLKMAAGKLASLVQDYPDDRPTLVLLRRAVERLTQPVGEFDAVWNLTQK